MASNFADSFFVAKLNLKVKGAGYNEYGQLGNQNYEFTNTFKDITIPNGKVADKIFSEYYDTIILMTDKTVWGCGGNPYGGLGIGNTETVYSLTQMITPVGYTVQSVHVGGGHTVLLMTDGTVWGSGGNFYGQLGIQNNEDQTTFVQMILPTGYTVDSIQCGTQHTILLMTDGTVWGCGWNIDGRLGLGDYVDRNELTQIAIPNGKSVQTISTGNTTFMLMTDGSLYGCGSNEYGQLSLGDNVDRNTLVQIPTPQNKVVDKIYASRRNTSLLMTDGTLWVCGQNHSGQLGQGHTNHLNTFTLLSIPSNNTISHISFTSFSLYIFMTNHSVWVCGGNTAGELGLGDYENRYVLTQNPYVAYSESSLTIQELKSINVNKYCYADYGYTLQDLVNSDFFSLTELKNLGFTLSELIHFFSVATLIQSGYTKPDFASIGVFFNNYSNICDHCNDC
jgi:alpha-tubulin suppressor-like RCC1 family protein